MPASRGTGGLGLVGVVLLPTLAASAVLLVAAAAGAQASPTPPGCGGGGTAQTIGEVRLDAEQMGNARTIVGVTAERHLTVYAAVVAVTTAYTESRLINSPVETDHDSEGLFQQRVRFYTTAVADDPVTATNAFLDRLLLVPNWATSPVGVDAQAVQNSAYPERYQPNAGLAGQLVGQFWAAASAAAGPAPATPSPGSGPPTSASASPSICVGGGGAGGSGVGPHGGAGNVAGSTAIPAGFVLNGTPAGRVAAAFALAQLGKPYVWGAAGPDAYDCSGLTMAAWAAAGVALPHHAASQTTAGRPEPTDLSAAVSGDLVMIPGSDGTAANPGHVGMVAGTVDTGGGRRLYLVQAPKTGMPVEVTPASAWSGQVVDVRHIG